MRATVRDNSRRRGVSAPWPALLGALAAVTLPGAARAEVKCVDARGQVAITNQRHCPEGFAPFDAAAAGEARRGEEARVRLERDARERGLAAARAAEQTRLREVAARRAREDEAARERSRRERAADIAAREDERRRREAEAARSAAGKRTLQVLLVSVALGLPAAWGLFAAAGLAVRSRRRPEEKRQASEACQALVAAVEALKGAPEYLAASDVARWRSQHGAAVDAPALERASELLAAAEARRARACRLEVKRLADTVAEANRAFVARRVAEEAAAFDAALPLALAARQREAIVTNDDVTLVIAGAGTGRGATVAGRVAYLLRRGLARPEEILVLAAGKRAARGLKEQLAALGAPAGVQLGTFHWLGVQVCAAGAGAKPSLSPMSEDGRQRKSFIRDVVVQMIGSPAQRPLVTAFLCEPFDEAPEPGRQRTGSQMIADARIRGLRAVDGTRVRSRDEVHIANWLTLNGIAWEYERPYPHATDAAGPEGYRPDFYLPEHDLYLEHFEVDRNGNTAPQVDGDTYRRSMEWKRGVHAENGTRLVETFSWHRAEGGLTANLARVLAEAGVSPGAPSDRLVDRIADLENRPFADLLNLLDHFLTLCKGGAKVLEAAEGRVRSRRDRAFLDLFRPVFDEYQAELARTRQIDFNDMIALARGHVAAGRFLSPFTHLVVDEIQDLSPNRLGLLLDLQAQRSGCRLFGVGDDWQSIYRFGGSDIGVLLELARGGEGLARVDLDTSFRCPQELLDLTSAFVQANPAQLRKSLAAHRGAAGAPAVIVIVSEAAARPRDAQGAADAVDAGGAAPADGPLESALGDILSRTGGAPASVLVIGRYRYNRPAGFDELAARFAASGLQLSFATAHGAKDAEADYAVVLDVEAGELGFPANIADDPVLQMALTVREEFPYAEERRLFYVALTRARELVYLLVPAERASPFVREELFAEGCAPLVQVLGEASGRLLCPRCRGRSIRPAGGRRGVAWGCEDFPACDGLLERCPDCQEGMLELVAPAGEQPSFRCSACGVTKAVCPKCGAGYLVERENRHGRFFGCSRWKPKGGCEHFEKS